MEEQLSNESSALLTPEPAKTSERSHQRSRKRSQEDQGREEQREPEPKLTEIEFLLTLWQSDCAELKQAGVEMALNAVEANGKPSVQLILLEVQYCTTCRRFRSTKEAHFCNE